MKTETITTQEKKTIQEQLWDIIVEISWGGNIRTIFWEKPFLAL